jgi:hypothetical protein
MAIAGSNAWAGIVQDERAAREECSAYSQAGMRDCLAEKARASEIALKRAEGKARSKLGKWIEDAKYVSLAKARLEASNKEFVRYREIQCAFNSSLGGGAIGNALEIMRLACVFELNARRAEQIRSITMDLPFK